MKMFRGIIIVCLLVPLLLSACNESVEIAPAEITIMPKTDNASEKTKVHSSVSVNLRYSEQEGTMLTEEDAALIKNALQGEWKQEIAECSNDIVFVVDGSELLYHTECGTFNDIVNNKHIVVGEGLQERINELIKKSLEIDSFEELS